MGPKATIQSLVGAVTNQLLELNEMWLRTIKGALTNKDMTAIKGRKASSNYRNADNNGSN